MTIAVFSSDELYILKKVWQDLSERSDHMGVCKQTFLKYIPMNGLLGERLFLQFDREDTGYISQESFIDGLSILCLGTIAEQSRFLFEIFDINKNGRIKKQDLNVILNYIPSDIFCSCRFRRRSMSTELLNDFMSYTNSCYCEDAFIHNKDYLDYDDFYNWVKHTPALIGYIKSVIPCMAEDDVTNMYDKFILWKKGDVTKFILKRFCLLKGNCLYYYYGKQDIRPKGIIFLAGSVVEQYDDDTEMTVRGYYGFTILQQYEEDPLHTTHHDHEKRIFFCSSLETRNDIIHKLQHLAQIIPFEEDYKIGKKIGTGAFSEVFECKHKTNGERCAVKIIKKSIFEKEKKIHQYDEIAILKEKEKRMHLHNEIAILKLVQHPNIIHLKETYEDKDNIYIVLELIEDGDFYDFILGRPCFKDNELRQIMKQLFEAIAYLHEFGIVHCDIKPENMLYNKTTGNIVKLTDFGLSRMILSNQTLDTVCGTLEYVAPEILSTRKSGMESDMWSSGIIMYLLSNGKLPYDNNNSDNILTKITSGPPSFKPHIGELAKDLMLGLLDPNPKKRITARDALTHPFINVKI